jgi:hypothetical protein
MSEQNENEVRLEVMQAAEESIEKNAELLQRLAGGPAPASDVQENTQLQADLDAAMDAEPDVDDPATWTGIGLTDMEQDAFESASFMQTVNDLAVDADAVAPELVFASKPGEITLDPSGNVFVNAGKAPEVVPNKYKANVGKVIVYAQKVAAYAHSAKTGEATVVLADGTVQPRPTLHGYVPKVGDYFVSAAPITRISADRAYVEAPETAIVGADLFNSLYSAVKE